MDDTRAGYGLNNGQTSVCPRHPDQITYVHCPRCGRLACGYCQVPLEVGMICRDCLAQAQAQAQARARSAGYWRSPLTSKPLVTWSLMGLNLLIWLLQLIFPAITQAAIYNPAWVEYSGQWYRALTAGFLHSTSNPSHLLLNLLTFYLFGQALEPLMGRWKFLTTYLLSILGGSLAVHLLAGLSGQMLVSTLGASGGVFGLFGAFFALAKARQQSTSSIQILIFINLASGFVLPGVSWEAHLGGLLAGALTAALLDRIPSRPRHS